jgi:hypothetical protein
MSSSGFDHLSIRKEPWLTRRLSAEPKELTRASQEVALQRTREAFLVLCWWNDGDFLSRVQPLFRLVFKRLRKRVASNSVHETASNLFPFFVNAEQQTTSKVMFPIKQEKPEGKKKGRTSSP